MKDGKFTGFDNDLITAVAAKLNLKPEFVGTDFSALLSQVNGGQFDLGSSSITVTEARKKTVAFSNGYDFGYLGLNTTKDSGITSFDQLTGKRVVVVQGTVQDDYATQKNLEPGPRPELQRRARPAQGRYGGRLGEPGRDRREDGEGAGRRHGDPGREGAQ